MNIQASPDRSASLEHRLRESQERFELAVRGANDGLWDWDMATDDVYFSSRWKSMLGYGEDELEHRFETWSALVHPDDLPGAMATLEAHLSGQSDFYQVEVRMRHKDGSYRWILARGASLRDDAGRPYRMAGSHTDITDRKRAEEELQRSEQRYRSLFEHHPDAVFAFDLDGHFTRANAACTGLSGYSAADLLRMTWMDVACPDMVETTRLHVESALQGRTSWFDSAILHRDGHRVELAASAMPIVIGGQVVGLYGIARDITDQRRAEQALRVSETRFRTLVEQSPLATQIYAPDGTLLQTNRAWERLWGVTQDQIPQYNPLHDPQLVESGIEAYIQRGFAGETVEVPPIKYEPEKTIPGVSDVPYRWVRAHIYPVKDENDKIREVVLLNEDISQQLRAEEQLKEKEQQYRSIFEATTDGVCITEFGGRVVEANPAVCAMHGYTYEEFVGIEPELMIAPECRAVFAQFAEALERGDEYHTRAVDIRKDGSRFHVDVHGKTIMFRGRRHILAVIRDVTDQVQAYELLEQRVQERTRELSTLLDLSYTVTSTLELKPLLQLIVDGLKDVADYDGASLLLRDGDYLTFFDRQGPGDSFDVLQERIPITVFPPFWERFVAGEAIIIPDVHSDDPMAVGWRLSVGRLAHGTLRYVRGWLAVPMMLKGQILGLLTLSSSEPAHFTERHATLALAVGRQAAVAVENARLYEQARQWAAADERARLARELHDSVTQALFSMTLHARTTHMYLEREGIDASSPLARSVRQLSDLTQGALAEMRALLFELRPGSLREEGLVAALRKQAAALSAREELTVEVQAPPGRIALDETIEAQLYRLSQEALHNVVKHAQASHVQLCLRMDDETVALEIADNGVGFDPSIDHPGHIGLSTMSERAHALGGQLELRTAVGQGTTVRVTVPLLDDDDVRLPVD
ncbi:MAG TPA: PAS domain S-box protein [Chloroflexota bacterium]